MLHWVLPKGKWTKATSKKAVAAVVGKHDLQRQEITAACFWVIRKYHFFPRTKLQFIKLIIVIVSLVDSQKLCCDKIRWSSWLHCCVAVYALGKQTEHVELVTDNPTRIQTYKLMKGYMKWSSHEHTDGWELLLVGSKVTEVTWSAKVKCFISGWETLLTTKSNYHWFLQRHIVHKKLTE